MSLLYNVTDCLIFVIQVHAVGMYGPTGAGVAEHLDFDAYTRAGKTLEPIPRSVMDRVDIITGESITRLSLHCIHRIYKLTPAYRYSWQGLRRCWWIYRRVRRFR